MSLECLLANPEADWERLPDQASVSQDEIERRVGPVVGPIEVLSGGQANATVRLGIDRVLRIYRRDPASLAKEAALLRRGWRSFRVPAVLAVGEDFLVLAYVDHTPVPDTAEGGAAVGRALAEVHATAYPSAGFLGPDLAISDPFPDTLTALLDYAGVAVGKWSPDMRTRVGDPLVACLRANEAALREAARSPVLLHGDFKAANLHATRDGHLLILDWEFAYAGPALMDVGQLLRWSPSGAWVEAFAAAYRAAGGLLPEDWRRLADVADLVNLSGLLVRAEAGSKREHDLVGRIQAITA